MTRVELLDVKKYFNGKEGLVKAVDGVSLTIEPGEIYGIVGYSGAGKSTLVRLLNGLELPTQGKIKIADQDLSHLNQRDLRQFRQKIGMIFQHFNLLWSRTVAENIALPLEVVGIKKAERLKKVTELIQLVGLEGREKAYPSQLSGGQKQRVGIARALATDPALLLVDEGTSALDPQTTDEVLDLLLEINQKLNLTIVLITHEMQVIRKICDKVAVMEAGKVVEEGEVLEVFSRPQKNVTKRFVQQETSPDPTELVDLNTLGKIFPAGQLARLTFTGEQAEAPIIAQAIREFSIDINVIQGQIQATQQSAFGTLVIQLLGNRDLNQAVLTYFKAKGVGVEVEKDD